LDIALETGHVIKPSVGWFSHVNIETGEIAEKKYILKDTDTKEFWLPIVTNPTFQDAIKKRYQISFGKIIADEDIDQELAEIPDDIEME
jgi:hypothetical protein